MSDTTENFYPSIPKRIKASLYDTVVLLILASIIMSIYFYIGIETPFIAVVIILSYVLYEPILVCTKGQTIGHSLIHFKESNNGMRDCLAMINYMLPILRLLLPIIINVITFSCQSNYFLLSFSFVQLLAKERIYLWHYPQF